MTEIIRQSTMFDRPMRVIDTPAARSTDPETSHIAAAEHTASGKRCTNVDAVVELVRLHPGCTSKELERYSTLSRHEIARRLPEAKTAGAVIQGPKRRCRTNGKLAVTWWLA